MKKILTIDLLCKEARIFAQMESEHKEKTLFGVTDGKAVGTYLEHKFQKYLHRQYTYIEGNTAKGIDFPELGVDMKVTSVKQLQSSCPFKSAKQKVFGLGYSLLVFVYEKIDNSRDKTGQLKILHTIYVDKSRTADNQTTKGLREIVFNSGNKEDIIAFMRDRYLPVDDIQANKLAEEILSSPPEVGYLTISNALQWRLQYSRIIQEAGQVDGVMKII